MPIPLKVLNRLPMGRDIAARVPPSSAENLAWVYIAPLFPERAYVGEPENRRWIHVTKSGKVNSGFLVRHLEVDAEQAEAIYWGFRHDLHETFLDERVLVPNETELEAVLIEWLPDYGDLHPPSGVRYLFENRHGLID